MISVWRFTTVNCHRVWRLYHLPAWLPPLRAAVLIGCGGYIAGQPLPAAPGFIPDVPQPVPYVYEPLPDRLPLAVAPGYEPGAVGPTFPFPRTALGAPRQMPGPFAGGAGTPSVSSVGPCCIQPLITDHPYSPPIELTPDVPVHVPEPPAGVLFGLAVVWLLGLRAQGLILALAFGATCWAALWWAV